MKLSWLCVLAILVSAVYADVSQATSAEEVGTFLEENKDNIAALFFLDSSLNEGQEGGFWNGVVSTVSTVFSAEEETGPNGQKVSDIEKNISQEAELMQIDVSNEDLRSVQESYDVTTVPFLIVFKEGVIVLKEVPTHETHDKVLQILGVDTSATSTEESTTSTESTSTETATPAEPAVAEQKETPAAQPAPQPQPTATHRHTNRPVLTPGASQDLDSQITLAPGERPPVAKPQPAKPAKTEATREYVHGKCTDVTTLDEVERRHWKQSPFYINNLEDYELPEDWWRNGYTPSTDNTTESSHYHYESKVQWTEPETFEYEASAPAYIAPRPAPYRRAPMFVEEPIRRAPFVVEEPVVRPRFERYTGKVASNTTVSTNSTSAVTRPIPAGSFRPTHGARQVHGARPVVAPTTRVSTGAAVRTSSAPVTRTSTTSTSRPAGPAPRTSASSTSVGGSRS
jgi:hypothetical protein